MKVEVGQDQNRHDLGIAPLAVGVLGRVKGFAEIVTQAIKSDELIVHRIAPVRKGRLKKNSLKVIFAAVNER